MLDFRPFYRKAEPRTFWARLAEEWFGIDKRSLAALRIGIALALLVDVASHIPNLKAHFSDAGILPRYTAELARSSWTIHFHMISGQWQFQAALFAVTALAALFLLVGFRTRAANFVAWILIVSAHNRDPYILQGADVLLRLLLFWGLFLPLGAWFSIDRMLDKRPRRIPERIASFGTTGYIAQIVCLYVFASVLKFHFPEWRDGRAIPYIMANDPFTSAFGRWTLNFPDLLAAATHTVTKFELLGPLLFFSPVFTGPVRAFALAIFALLQGSFALCLTLGEFPFISLIATFGLIPSWFWDRLPRVRIAPIYRRIADRLRRARIRPSRPVPLSSPAMNILALIFTVHILYWNICTTDNSRWKFPSALLWISGVTRVDQVWNLFLGNPMRCKGWYVMPARLSDGSEIDLFTEKPVTWQVPRLVSATYPDQRWRKYLSGLYYNNEVSLRPYYAYYLCNKWNARHPDRKVDSLEIVYFWMNYDKGEYERMSLIRWDGRKGQAV